MTGRLVERARIRLPARSLLAYLSSDGIQRAAVYILTLTIRSARQFWRLSVYCRGSSRVMRRQLARVLRVQRKAIDASARRRSARELRSGENSTSRPWMSG